MSSPRATLFTAIVLSLGAAVSLGLARFSYAVLLPPMRTALGWNYATAGSMNTVNAVGYLVGALLAPRAVAALGARQLLLLGGVVASLCLAAHAMRSDLPSLYALRMFTGVASAAMFVSGGVLAARLASQIGAPQAGGHDPRRQLSPSLVMGMFYGGTGWGIVASACLMPVLATQHWTTGWWVLAALSLACTALMALRVPALSAAAPASHAHAAATWRTVWRDFRWGLLAYACFGLGYIGYMTFIIALLREQAMGDTLRLVFYALLGAGVIASPWLWAGLLQRHRDGQALSLLSALLAVAALLPTLAANAALAMLSGLLFGCVFLALVSSTTALVRHNLPMPDWTLGIGLFTTVFALGQIIGPVVSGWLSDGAGQLTPGFWFSSAALALGFVLARFQRALPAVSAAG